MSTKPIQYEQVAVTELQVFTVNSEKPIEISVTAEDHYDIETQSHDVHVIFGNGNSIYVNGKYLVGWSKVTRQVRRAIPAAIEVPSGDRSVR